MAIRSSLFTNLLRRYSSKTSNILSPRAAAAYTTSGSTSVNFQEESADSSENQENHDDLKTRLLKLRFPKRSATTAIQKWISQGNQVTLPELRQLAKDLNRSHRFKHALEISEWIVTRKEEFELTDSDYAMRIDLMTKVFGVDSAERYFEGLPAAAKTGETYTALLHSYASAKLIDRAENLFFERIQGENVPVSALAYNEMMTLYVSVGQLEKVKLVIEEMKRRNVPRDVYSYNLWISSCAGCMDIDSVRKILEEMSDDCNSKEGWVAYRQLTEIYVSVSNLVNSCEDALVESERKISQREWITYDFLIILYTGLRYKERIDAIWKSLKLTAQKMTSRNYMCILSSYVMLGEFEEAGGVLDEWKQSKSVDFDAQQCRKLVDAFAGVGLVEKAELLRTLNDTERLQL
ncbi:hypothetical protein MKW94_023110 [Papaver nudicaule]|uniref:Pentatricopeptide repeat-containing protein n=1 Tax=Papaver nudicaule TaxID=74823 RepID=A0AA41VE53_PAPNU|nr:hypothetical protein [Papaver nudicaule]